MILGAIAGDMIGSPYEFGNIKTTEFPLFIEDSHFTDDSVMTLAVAEGLMEAVEDIQPITYSLVSSMRTLGRKYPNAGYGGMFAGWLYDSLNRPFPYRSWGNGAGMRVSPVAWAYDSLDLVEFVAAETAKVTHNHVEGVRGAQAVAGCTFLARMGKSNDEIRNYVRNRIGYALDFTLDGIRDGYSFDVSCQGSVPQAIEAFLESDGFEDAVRKAVSIGGDSDTIGAMTASIAQGRYGVPDSIEAEVRKRLPEDLLEINDRFCSEFGVGVADRKVRRQPWNATRNANTGATIGGFNKDFYFLSNFFEAPVELEGIMYRNSEAAYQAGRCKTEAEKRKFADLDAGVARKRAHHEIETRDDWEGFRLGHMRRVVSAKFHQNLDLAWELVHLDGELVELNDWHDNYWGDCCCPDCKGIPGQNMLGRVLMDVRKELRDGIARNWPRAQHEMKLAPGPFEKVASGVKTIELRLYDEKRRKVRVGDAIVFHPLEGSRPPIGVAVTGVAVYPSFDDLFGDVDLAKCGYTPEEIDGASAADMDAYYSADEQERCSVVAISFMALEGGLAGSFLGDFDTD